MKEFICPKCGGKSYSSVDIQYQVDPTCPYCGFYLRIDRVQNTFKRLTKLEAAND